MAKAKKSTKKTTKTTKKTVETFTRLKALLKGKTGKKTAKTLTKAQALYLASIEKQLANVPDGQRGNGGLVVKENGKLVMKTFETKEEALALVKKIRAGEVQLG